MQWWVKLVPDDVLDADWTIVIDDKNEYMVIARESVVDAEPARITTEVVAAMRELQQPEPELAGV